MGMADVATILFKNFLRFDPKILAGLIEIDLFFPLDMDQCFLFVTLFNRI